MRVYEVRIHEYPEDQGIEGIYSSLDNAMNSRPEDIWIKDGEESWNNDRRYDDYAAIFVWTLDEKDNG
jgi:hypothetical protein